MSTDLYGNVYNSSVRNKTNIHSEEPLGCYSIYLHSHTNHDYIFFAVQGFLAKKNHIKHIFIE